MLTPHVRRVSSRPQSPSSLDTYRSSRCSRVASTNAICHRHESVRPAVGTGVPRGERENEKGDARHLHLPPAVTASATVMPRRPRAGACRRPRGWSDVGGAGLTGMEPAKRASHRMAAIRSRGVLAGSTRCVAIRTARRHAGGRLARVIPRVRCGPQRHSRVAPSLRDCPVWTPMRDPRLEQDAPSRQAGCLRRRGRHRPHAQHSSPHPRRVQLLLIDQQIASALPLAQ
jgi:hypothetical protein